MNEPKLCADNCLFRSHLPFIIVNTKGIPEEWNEAARQLFPGIGEKNIRCLVLKESNPEDTIKFEYLLTNGISEFTFDFSNFREDGTRVWLSLKASKQSDGRFFTFLDNVTNQKLKETHLILAKETAEKASMKRSQFLANISHEIRTPIQTIIGMMELLTDTKLDEEQTEYARQVRFSADVMLTLINDILDFSKVEAGQLKIEKIEFNIIDTIERTVDLVSMEAHKKELEILIDIDPELPAILIGDPGRIQQIVLNLVKNAVKFTVKGQITVKASAKKNQAQLLLVEVVDTGIGISAEIQSKLFTQFFQGDSSTTRKYGGTGLGLAISRNIVELMEGAIGVRSNEQGGSIFWFEIPLEVAPNQMPAVAILSNPETSFLVVDDNVQTCDLLTGMLLSLGYANVTRVNSGASALELLSSARQSLKPFDIVFIDMVMPEMDGWRLAAKINKDRNINQARLYLMVPEGSFGADAKMKLLEWFNGYLYKPIKRRMLVDLLKNHWQSTIDLEVVDEPIVEVEEAELVEELPEEPALPGIGLTVLIAEDHPVNRKLLKIFLEKAGAHVVLAEDGQESTECIAREKIDIVFMDIQMPRMNGYEATEWMRNNGYTQPVIACTASAQEHEKEQCLSYGMNDILPKPYKRQEVIDIMLKYTRQGPAVFDGAEFFEIMMGDAESGRALLKEFRDQTEAHVSLLEEDIRKGDIASAKSAAHLIKGSALNVTAAKLADAALCIEKMDSAIKQETMIALLAALKNEFHVLNDTLIREGYIR